MTALETSLFQGLSLKEQDQVFKDVFSQNGNRDRIATDCRTCGACCVAFTIPGIKKHGEVCSHLIFDKNQLTCAIYPSRPFECQKFDCSSVGNKPVDRLTELFSAKVTLKRLIEQGSSLPSEPLVRAA